MASTRRKAAAAGLAVIGIAGLSLAAAAQLTVNSDTLQAGAIAVGTCDGDGVRVTYTNAFSGGAYNATGVSVTGIAPTCGNGDIKMTLTYGPAGSQQTREFTGTIAPAGGTFTPSAFGTAIPAADLTNVAIVITK